MSTVAAPKQRVAYYYDDDVGTYAYSLHHPMKPQRIRMAHNLILNYGLDKHMNILRPSRATAHQMTAFHTDEFIDFLQRVTPETGDELTGHGTRYLIGEDCPPFEGVFEFCTISAGGSLCSARKLNTGQADICVNWAGGLHHAKKREASGFCYVNDINLAILELLRYHSRVLYIDIDVHHGDGVEEAFYATDRVMSCSFHKFGDFFPGTGNLLDRGVGKGKGYAVNVPLRDGIDDETYGRLFKPIIQHIMDYYRPGAVILQCGADSLAEDKLGSFNLSMKGHAQCVEFVKSFNIPMMCLGGGGYTVRNVSRTWAYETGVCVGMDLDEQSPHLPFNEYMEHFGPEYKLNVPPNNMDNRNTPDYLNHIRESILEGMKQLPFAPSVPLQYVPPDLPDEDYDEDEELDARITQRQKDLMVTRYGDDGLDEGEAASMPAQELHPSGRAKRRNARARSPPPTRNGGHHHDEHDQDLGGQAKRLKRSFFNNLLPPEDLNGDLAAMSSSTVKAW